MTQGAPSPEAHQGPCYAALALAVSPPHWTASPSLSINPSPGWSLLWLPDLAPTGLRLPETQGCGGHSLPWAPRPTLGPARDTPNAHTKAKVASGPLATTPAPSLL